MFASPMRETRRSSCRPFSTPTVLTTRGPHGTASRRSVRFLFKPGAVSSGFIQPTRPLSTVNAVDSNVKAPITHELLIGMDRSCANLGVSATYLEGRMADLTWKVPTGIQELGLHPRRTLTVP